VFIPATARTPRITALFLCMALAAFPVSGRAISPERIAKTNHATWEVECSMCHVAYPANFLPSAAWQRIMATLPRHFGQNAALDTPAARAVRAYLMANSADVVRNGPDLPRDASAATPTSRITRQPWFSRIHARVSPTGVTPTMATCDACHRGAAEGDFTRD